MELSAISSYTTSMEETAETEKNSREKIRVAAEKAQGKPVESVTPPTEENVFEAAQEMFDIGGKNEEDSPSKSFLERLKARIKGETKKQE